jgi:hypothetical protein
MIAGGAGAVVVSWNAAYRANWNLPFNADHGWCWFAVALMSLFGIGFLVGGFCLMKYSKRLISFRVDFFANGFCHRAHGLAESVFWSEVACVRKTNLYQRLPLLKGAAKAFMPTVESNYYTVVMKSGKKIIFSGNDVQPIRRFGQLLVTQASAKSIPWEVVEERC